MSVLDDLLNNPSRLTTLFWVGSICLLFFMAQRRLRKRVVNIWNRSLILQPIQTPEINPSYRRFLELKSLDQLELVINVRDEMLLDASIALETSVARLNSSIGKNLEYYFTDPSLVLFLRSPKSWFENQKPALAIKNRNSSVDMQLSQSLEQLLEVFRKEAYHGIGVIEDAA